MITRLLAILSVSFLLWLFLRILVADYGYLPAFVPGFWPALLYLVCVAIVWQMFRVFSPGYDPEGGPPESCSECGHPIITRRTSQQ